MSDLRLVLTHPRPWAVALLCAVAIAGAAEAQQADQADRVTVQSGGDYISYPAKMFEYRSDGSVAYTIDMTTAILSRLGTTVQQAVTMTVHRREKSDAEVCFLHEDISICRNLELPEGPYPPTFIPTLRGIQPTVYAKFSNADGEPEMIVYSGGRIETMAESFSGMSQQ
jgi:hypothetical protein